MKAKLLEKIEKEIFNSCLNSPLLIEELLKFSSHFNSEIILDLIKLYTDGIDDPNLILNALLKKGHDIKKYYTADYTYNPESLVYNIKLYIDIKLSIEAEKFGSLLVSHANQGHDGLDILTRAKNDLENLIDRVGSSIAEINFSSEIPSLINKLVENDHTKIQDLIKFQDLPTLNIMTGGLKQGNVLVLAAAYKQGKTTLGLSMTLDAVLNSKIPAAIFSLEQTLEEIYNKMISLKLPIDYNKLRVPQYLTQADKNTLREKLPLKFKNTKMFVFCDIIDEIELRHSIRTLVRKHKIKLVLLDYIGLMKTSTKFESREQEIAHLSRSIKQIAKEFRITVIVTAQLNRQGVNDPSSINMAESLALNRDSDFVLTVAKGSEMKTKECMIGYNKINLTENHFIITLTNSRHTPSGKQFLAEYKNSGEFIEIDTRYDSQNYNKYKLKNKSRTRVRTEKSPT